MTEIITAAEIREGDIIDFHTGLDFNRTGFTRDWRTITALTPGSEGRIDIHHERGMTSADPTFKFTRKLS